MEGEGEILFPINSELLTAKVFNGFSEYRAEGDQNQDHHENVNSMISCSSCDHVINWNARAKQKGKGTSWVKGQWSTEEDRKLMKLVRQYGLGKWAVIAEHMVGRIGKQCRERWQNHLRPDIKKSDVVWTDEEEKLIVQGHEKLGNRWAKIAKCVPGRSENSIKNHWNATKRKQTSKRKIRRPERLRGLTQSTVLEEYIKKIYLNKVSTTTQHQPSVLGHNIYNNHTYYDHDSTTYFLLETFDEEVDFMKDLFANKDNPKQIIHNNNNNDGRNSISSSSSDFSVSAQTIDVGPYARENVGNNSSAFYLENNGIPTEEAQQVR